MRLLTMPLKIVCAGISPMAHKAFSHIRITPGQIDPLVLVQALHTAILLVLKIEKASKVSPTGLQGTIKFGRSIQPGYLH